MLTRRAFGGLAASSLSSAFASNHIGVSRLSAITDEIATTPAGAIEFCKQYGLKWVEIRSVPGPKNSYLEVPGDEIKALAKQLRDHHLGVSFIDSSMFKYILPGTDPIRRANVTEEVHQKRLAGAAARFEKRNEELRKWLHIAHTLRCDKLRFFAFSRVAEPQSLYPRIAEIAGEAAEIAGREGVRLILENEYSCNVGTSSELAALANLLPARRVGINWDPENGAAHERPYPDGYALLPKQRIENVQVKGRNIIPGLKGVLPWDEIFRTLEKDDYKGKVGLETHIFDNLIPSAHAAMKEMVRIAGKV
ncbi:MAG: TIM barrel protein [Acidobacteria bacterium]|nr:TIM barrel protein [Acidobacteriota bacterium]